MIRWQYRILLVSLLAFMISCTGASVGVYHRPHGYNPWWGGRTYYRDRVIVVPPEEIEPPGEIEPPLVAVPLPSGPEPMPDMGMPDMDFDMGDF